MNVKNIVTSLIVFVKSVIPDTEVISRTTPGQDNFELYKTEKSSINGSKAWEKLLTRFTNLPEIDYLLILSPHHENVIEKQIWSVDV